jgi:hypothetical protein
LFFAATYSTIVFAAPVANAVMSISFCAALLSQFEFATISVSDACAPANTAHCPINVRPFVSTVDVMSGAVSLPTAILPSSVIVGPVVAVLHSFSTVMSVPLTTPPLN